MSHLYRWPQQGQGCWVKTCCSLDHSTSLQRCSTVSACLHEKVHEQLYAGCASCQQVHEFTWSCKPISIPTSCAGKCHCKGYWIELLHMCRGQQGSSSVSQACPAEAAAFQHAAAATTIKAPSYSLQAAAVFLLHMLPLMATRTSQLQQGHPIWAPLCPAGLPLGHSCCWVWLAASAT